MKGFTIVELIITLAIICILGTFITVQEDKIRVAKNAFMTDCLKANTQEVCNVKWRQK